MHLDRYVLVLLATILLAFSAIAAADEKASSAPEQVLKSKGLVKRGNNVSLDDEKEFKTKSDDLQKLKKQVQDALLKESQTEQTVEDKKKLIIAYTQKRRELRVQLQRAPSPEIYNKIVGAMEELGDRIDLMEKDEQTDKARASAHAAAEQIRESYIEHVLQTRKILDKLKERYDDVAADGKVAQAVEQYNKASGKTLKLAPTPAFVNGEKLFKKVEDTVLSETIDIEKGDGDLWGVSVVFGGKYTQKLEIDTGASVIGLPWAMAKAIGLQPTEKDPTIQLQMADGRIIDAKEKIAPSVRVGKFVVEDVPCAVMPEDIPNASAMLGQSFLNHFTYKIDTARSKLVMTKVEGVEPKKPAAKRPAPGQKPSEARPKAASGK